jgi:hypothetical protein
MMSGVDWSRVTEAIGLAQKGQTDQGRTALEACWAASDEADHAVRCVVAHYLADLQTELDAEIAWDERALVELPHLRDEDVAGLGVDSAAGFAPSLHLNLGDGYLRRGDTAAARHHLEQGRASLGALGEDAYGVMVRRGFERLAARIESPGVPPRRR